MIDGLHLWVRMMTNVINHRQANGQACRGLWSSLPPKGHVLSYLLCHVVMQRGEYTASRASPLHPWKLSIVWRTDILVRCFLVKRTRDSLIYLEENGEFVSESTPGQVGGETLQEQREFVGLTSLSVSLLGSVCLSLPLMIFRLLFAPVSSVLSLLCFFSCWEHLLIRSFYFLISLVDLNRLHLVPSLVASFHLQLLLLPLHFWEFLRLDSQER